jgi:hypothetical protein
MNLPSLYVGLAIVILILLPFIIGALKGRSKTKKITREFLNAGEQKGISFSETQAWNDRIMGVDKRNKKLLFKHSNPVNSSETLIDLKQVSTCMHEVKYNKASGDDKVIESIWMIFKMKNGGGTDLISVYDADFDMNVYSELEIAEKWTRKINDLVA